MIIQSMLDQDQYKLSMLQAVLHQFPSAMVEYRFKCRTPNIDFRAYVADIIKEVNLMCNSLEFKKDELEFLGDECYMKKDTLEFLKLFKFDYKFVNIQVSDKGEMFISIKGPWIHTILFEIPILAIISEIYSRSISVDFLSFAKRADEKICLLNTFKQDTNISVQIAEFGGRRRHSVEAHEAILQELKEYCSMEKYGTGLIGTSNVMFAKKYGLKVIGTMAHEWLQAHQSLYRVEDSQTMAFENWAKEYRGDLGIALSDVIGLKYFLHDFDKYFAKLYDGTRQDSGDPFDYGKALIKHYESMDIDPMTKSITFSDGLTIPKAIDIATFFEGKIRHYYGIGTDLTNDFGFKPLQNVIKMVSCNGNSVAKLSDSPGKTMSQDQAYLAYLNDVFQKRIHRTK